MKQGITLGVFSATLFISAAIMFAVQPMTGKMLLPLVGGTPAGWVVALAFFQIMLLLGYLLAHGFARFNPYAHGGLYLLCLLAGAFFLPVGLGAEAGAATSATGAAGIFWLLCLAVGPPFVALSATSSTVQRLFTATGHPSAGDPYFLYMASNLGSFAGLLLYPLLAEPRLTLGAQSQGVSLAYAALALLALACLVNAKMTGKKEFRKETRRPPADIPWKRRLHWLALSFVPSSLLLGTTTYITTDVLSAPLIWVLPLGLYLLTFVIAFSRKPIISLRFVEWLHPYVICAAVFFMALMQATWLGGWMGVVFYLFIFGAVALACHMKLASLRPDESGLTTFYLMMSVGGAAGGVLNAFIVSYVFNRLAELPLMLLASFLLHPAFSHATRAGRSFVVLLALAVLAVNMREWGLVAEEYRYHLCFAALLTLLLSPLFFKRLLAPANIVLCALAVFIGAKTLISDDRLVLSHRNFYGTIRVYETQEEGYTVRKLRHGSTIHGAQVLDKKLEREPTGYYAKSGPLADIFKAYNPVTVGGVGLGAGAVNCYSAPARVFTFIELDPDITATALREFTFLDKCATKRKPVILTGDGRLELEKLNQKFDLMVLDAFTSDAIPTHLLTKEALELYFKKSGVLAIHISNRYFELWDVIAATAKTLGYSAKMRAGINDGSPFYAAPSIWLVAGAEKQLARLPKSWKRVTPAPGVRPWTDDYSNLLDTLK